jgi:hypothetical protein
MSFSCIVISFKSFLLVENPNKTGPVKVEMPKPKQITCFPSQISLLNCRKLSYSCCYHHFLVGEKGRFKECKGFQRFFSYVSHGDNSKGPTQLPSSPREPVESHYRLIPHFLSFPGGGNSGNSHSPTYYVFCTLLAS